MVRGIHVSKYGCGSMTKEDLAWFSVTSVVHQIPDKIFPYGYLTGISKVDWRVPKALESPPKRKNFLDEITMLL